MVSKLQLVTWILSLLAMNISLLSLGMAYKRLMIKRKYVDICQALFWIGMVLFCIYLSTKL